MSSNSALKKVTEIFRSRAYDCDILRFSHVSPTLGGLETKWHAIVPDLSVLDRSESSAALPVLYWLSGLTCTDENFVQKAGAARSAAEHRVAIIAPDTSPRTGAPDEYDDPQLRAGAGFYVDAITPDFKKHYQMYSFVLSELPQAVSLALGDRVDISRSSIFGHSMGGHGAIMMYLRNSDKYRSVSALAPICHPSESLLGLKCFGNYLGEDGEGRAAWRSYDSTEIMRARARSGAPPLPVNILIDQGYEDIFYTEKTLLPEHFVEACESAGQQVTLRMHENYTHDYFFIQTFLPEHIAHHASCLRG